METKRSIASPGVRSRISVSTVRNPRQRAHNRDFDGFPGRCHHIPKISDDLDHLLSSGSIAVVRSAARAALTIHVSDPARHRRPQPGPHRGRGPKDTRGTAGDSERRAQRPFTAIGLGRETAGARFHTAEATKCVRGWRPPIRQPPPVPVLSRPGQWLRCKCRTERCHVP
jgi:hypothetical protein